MTSSCLPPPRKAPCAPNAGPPPEGRHPTTVASLLFIVTALLAFAACGESSQPQAARDTAPQPAAPAELNQTARQGETVFNTHCAQCHGPEASGTNLGPTLIDRIYHPGHHGDAAFHLAVLRGVRQHHWNFGNMLPVPGVSETQVNQIICYVRHLQRTHNIYTPAEYQPTC